ncbi:MAG TPA: AAA family ATPase [Candidatus Aquilonibacter sp.]
MGSLFGRDAAFTRGRTVLDSAARSHIVRAVRVVGTSGVGKTALADALAQEAAAQGWLVVWTPNFRIHTSLPMFAARRIVQSMLEALGESAGRYSSGLTVDRADADEFREAFLRIVEGVTLDHRLLLVVDDAMWADAESRSLIEHTVSTLVDRAIVILSTERSDESGAPAFELSDQTVVLDDLTPAAAVEIVRAIYPGVNDDVASAIAAATRGHAVDVVAVATSARESGARNVKEVSDSTRRVVVRDLGLLEPQTRTFLQLAALIDEPIEFSLLTRLWPRETLLEMISSVSGRYLIEGSDGMHFVHSTILDSVLETIPIEIPLRYRIIDALKALPSPRLEDLERLAAQYKACGDRQLERETLLKLADAATATSLYSLATDAIERALRIAPASQDELVPLYTRLSQMYNATGRAPDAIRVSTKALEQARGYGMTEGLGSIVGSLALGLSHNGESAAAHDALERYDALLRSDADRAQVVSVAEYVAVYECDVERARRFSDEFESIALGGNSVMTVRHHISRAFLSLRTGDEAAAIASIREAERRAESLPVYVSTMPRACRMLHALQYDGMSALERYLESRDDELNDALTLVLQGAIMFGRGALEDLRDFVPEVAHRYRDSQVRGNLVGLYAAALALTGQSPEAGAWAFVKGDISSYLSGMRTPALVVLMSAWALAQSSHHKADAHRLLEELIPRHAKPFDLLFPRYPILLALAARNIGDIALLGRLSEEGAFWCDDAPWHRAHSLLARGAVNAALSRSEGAALLLQAREIFSSLDAPYFAHLAQQLAGHERTTTQAVRVERPSNTTRREREIAALVSEGLTNREIAERLVLSERTVEGHIANLFAKVNVNSRTQLATWYLRLANSVA